MKRKAAPSVDVLDVSETDRVTVIAEAFIPEIKEPVFRKTASFPIPEEYMDKIEDLIGDGSASITVGVDLKRSQDYRTAGCFVSVKLTCGQDKDTLIKAQSVARNMAISFAQSGFEDASVALEEVCNGNKPKLAEPPKSLVPKKATKTIKKEEADPEPNRGQSGGVKRLLGKPGFKR
jgi:hypothetical protein